MEPTTIILIVIFAICGLVLLWAFKNGNNIKFKKKEKSEKKKKAPKDKQKEEFKEVIPKEKKEKQDKNEKTEKKEKKLEPIRDVVKDEKAGKVEAPSNKISKITKEDFESNNITVPKSLGGEDKSVKPNKSKDVKLKQKEFDLPPLSGLGGLNFDDEFLKEDLASLGLREEDYLGPSQLTDKLLDDPFLAMSDEDQFMLGKDMGLGLGDIPMSDFNNFPPPTSLGMPTKSNTKGEIKTESIEARLERVFGDDLPVQPGIKEVIVGEILSGNRSKVNRELREKRKKWMK